MWTRPPCGESCVAAACSAVDLRTKSQTFNLVSPVAFHRSPTLAFSSQGAGWGPCPPDGSKSGHTGTGQRITSSGGNDAAAGLWGNSNASRNLAGGAHKSPTLTIEDDGDDNDDDDNDDDDDGDDDDDDDDDDDGDDDDNDYDDGSDDDGDGAVS
eukprot:GHVT01069924.1.p1 GENE.GHVT01069924.1~~GHVT01069924.1.p1  ORF type:complete len:155 (+),score=46.29 GHVT01069924.1:1769-2233(+)